MDLLSEGHRGSRHQPVSGPGLDLCEYRSTVVQNVSFRARGPSRSLGSGDYNTGQAKNVHLGHSRAAPTCKSPARPQGQGRGQGAGL